MQIVSRYEDEFYKGIKKELAYLAGMLVRSGEAANRDEAVEILDKVVRDGLRREFPDWVI